MSKLPKLVSSQTKGSTDKDTDVELLFVYQNSAKKPQLPKGNIGQAFKSHLERLQKKSLFTGAANSMQYLRFGGRGPIENVLFLGVGEIPSSVTPETFEEKVRNIAGHAWAKINHEKSVGLSVELDTLITDEVLSAGHSAVGVARAFAEGLMLGAYHYQGLKKKSTDENYDGPSKISFRSDNKDLLSEIETILDDAEAVAKAVNVTRDWSNEPSNIGTPEFYAQKAKKLAQEYGLKIKVLSEKEAEKQKMGLFLGVGIGSDREGKIVVLEYNPKAVKGSKAKTKTITLVGKGITFDSGGISLKPASHMEDMKHDMTGAATVMGAMMLAAHWKVPNKVVAVMGFTENMPSGCAIQPGNVLTSRSGKTVEVINTDAEGRLILADLMDYAQDYNPDYMVDIATLTGAVSIALGNICTAVLGNDEPFIETVRKAGSKNGEKFWQLPMYDEYFNELKSDSADMRNSSNDRLAGTIKGAIFLKQFVKKDVKWAHLDIAATSTDIKHLSYIPKKGASGLVVRTLAEITRSI